MVDVLVIVQIMMYNSGNQERGALYGKIRKPETEAVIHHKTADE